MITASGRATPYDPRCGPDPRMLTGEAMPSWARLVATATIGRPSRVLANLAVSRTRPPPMATTAS